MLLYLDTLIGFAVVMLVVSLLITIMNQIVSALFNHRGSNLRWGLKTLFENVDPIRYSQLRANAGTLADEVLTHCLISDSWFSENKAVQWLAARIPALEALFKRYRLASFIRPKELVDILGHLAAAPPGELAALPLPALKELVSEIEALLAAESTSGTPDMTLAIAAAAAAAPVLQESVNAIRRTAENLDTWFGSMMDRAAQRFIVYMRIWTVLFACVFAFGTGLNAISLMSELYSNGAYRTALAGTGQQVTAAAVTVLDSKGTVAGALTDALKQALKDANVTGAPEPPNIQATADGIQWIQANVPAGQRDAALSRFNAVSMEASQKIIDEGAQNAARLITIVSKTGFDVLKFRWPNAPNIEYIAGVFVTAALLSLGAPFWFNALKSMTSLRPIVAEKDQPAQSS